MAGYNRFSTNKQYAIANLLIKMQELTTTDDEENNCDLQGTPELCILAPTTQKLGEEPRKRVKPAREQGRKQTPKATTSNIKKENGQYLS